MKQEMLINVSQPEECRIAIMEDGVLEELYVERTSQDNLVGNIYKGRIVNIEPSIQAAFVDFGVGRNGFLHISDVEPQYYRQGGLDPDKAFDLVDPSGQRGRGRAGPAEAAARRPAASEAADPGRPPPGRRGARAGDQGGLRHEGADPLDLHLHPRPLPRADAAAGPRGHLQED
jgi:ribonuclease E